MGHRVWKDGTRRGIAYVENRAAAEHVMTVAGRKSAPAPAPGGKRRRVPAASGDEASLEGAMAVYLDRRGKPYAWQIPFDIRCWDQISAILAPPADAARTE